MITRVDERLRQEARRFRLRFTCEACNAFDDQRERCVYGYPTEAHRGIDLDTVETLLFCKAFEP